MGLEEHMSSVKRVYVEKKKEFAVQANALKHEIISYLGIQGVENVRVLIRYDVENLLEFFKKYRANCRAIAAKGLSNAV